MTRARGAACFERAMAVPRGPPLTPAASSLERSLSRSVPSPPISCCSHRQRRVSSSNGGRDWEIEAPEVLVGPAFAVASTRTGACARVCASAIFRNDGDGWRPIGAGGAEPARAFVAGLGPRAYLRGGLGWVVSSDNDWGTSWTERATGFRRRRQCPGGGSCLPEGVFAIVAGRLWASFDGARRWRPGAWTSPPGGRGVHSRVRPEAHWAVAAGQLFRSRRGWAVAASGRPLPERRWRAASPSPVPSSWSRPPGACTGATTAARAGSPRRDPSGPLGGWTPGA